MSNFIAEWNRSVAIVAADYEAHRATPAYEWREMVGKGLVRVPTRAVLRDAERLRRCWDDHRRSDARQAAYEAREAMLAARRAGRPA
jgi:quinol monooxygenase YgiN